MYIDECPVRPRETSESGRRATRLVTEGDLSDVDVDGRTRNEEIPGVCEVGRSKETLAGREVR